MQQITGTIQSAEEGRSGKSLRVSINGQWFSSKNWELKNMVGQVITFTPSSSEFQGKTYLWVNEFNVGTQGVQTTNSKGEPKAPTNTNDMAYLPMTSNLVAHAIQAGKIETPDQIQAWAKAAFHAAKSLIEGGDEFDDEIPF